MARRTLAQQILLSIRTREEVYNKKYMETEDESIYGYFLTEDVTKALNFDDLRLENTEIINTKEGLIIESIYGTIKVFFVDSQIGFQIIGVYDQKEVFKIAKIKSNVYNEVVVDGITYHYSIDLNSNTFTYAEQSNTQTLFQGRVKPLYAKFKDFETFVYERDIPPVVKSPSLFQQILDRVKNNEYLNIRTSSELLEVTECCDSVFQALKDKADNERIVIENEKEKIRKQG